MKKFFCLIAMLSLSVAAFAQGENAAKRVNVISSTVNDGQRLEVLNVPVDGTNHYFLSVGNMARGNGALKIVVDPFKELFVPIGETLAESQDNLKKMEDLFKQKNGTTVKMPGSYAQYLPEEKMDTLTVGPKAIVLGRNMQFVLEKDGETYTASFNKSDIGGIISSLKMYRTFHKKEK